MNTKKRVAKLEEMLFAPKPDATADTVEPERVSTRLLDGRFMGTIQDGDGLRVHIERPLTFSRDVDGSWLVYAGEHAASVSVVDPLACDALDTVFELVADPDGVGSVIIREPKDD
jgi:hypothetical protein